ncbi:hypothetical protein ACLB2K_043985 [Fragaria x ananassa]
MAATLSKLLSSLLLLPPPPPQELPPPPRVPLPLPKRAPPALVASCWAPSNVAFPSLANSNLPFFSSAGFNAQVTVQENEPEEWLINRFRREVIRAGVPCSVSARRGGSFVGDLSLRVPLEAIFVCSSYAWLQPHVLSSQSRYRNQFKQQKPEKDNEPKRKEDSDNDDNWDFYEVDLPYN